MPTRRLTSSLGAALATVLVLALGAPSASGFDASAELVPSTIDYFGLADARTTSTVQHRLHVTAGATEERVLIEDANSIDVIFGPVLEGPGTLALVSTRQAIGDDFGFRGRDGCRARGLRLVSPRYELVLPAGSTATVVFERRLVRSGAPLDGREFVRSYLLAATPAGGPEAPLTDAVTIATPVAALTGLTGARLELRAGLTGSGKAIGPRERLAVRRGSAITLSGSLGPGNHAGSQVTIWTYPPGATKPRRLAVARVQPNGRFARRWRPRVLGRWELFARWPGAPGRVERTRSPCGGPQLEVTATGRPPSASS